MKNIFFILSSALILFGCSSNKTTKLPNNLVEQQAKKPTTENINSKSSEKATVAGKNYIGAPSKEQSRSGCEGCGERGSFEFSGTDNNVEFIWPGSDIMDGGTYVQKGNKITISSGYGDTYTFTLSADHKEITDNKYNSVFRDTDYPWEE